MNRRLQQVRQETGLRDSPFAVFALLAVVGASLCGCGSVERRGPAAESEGAPPAATGPQAPRRGGYYKDDGPGDHPPANLDAIPDARPRPEPLHRFANNPYTVFGQNYAPFKEPRPHRQRGLASWYGRRYNGQQTSSGEPYDMYAMTAAHPILPIPSYARVTNLANGKSVVVRINDRGPFHSDRIIDLSYTAAYKLGFVESGSARVEIDAVLPTSIAAGDKENSPPTGGAARPAEPLSEARPAAPAPVIDSRPLAAPAESGAIPLAVDASGVWLQLGAFSARENAENFRVRVYQSVAWLNQAMEILAKDGLFRLQLGPYRDRSEARGIAERLSETLDLKPVFVVR